MNPEPPVPVLPARMNEASTYQSIPHPSHNHTMNQGSPLIGLPTPLNQPRSSSYLPVTTAISSSSTLSNARVAPLPGFRKRPLPTTQIAPNPSEMGLTQPTQLSSLPAAQIPSSFVPPLQIGIAPPPPGMPPQSTGLPPPPTESAPPPTELSLQSTGAPPAIMTQPLIRGVPLTLIGSNQPITGVDPLQPASMHGLPPLSTGLQPPLVQMAQSSYTGVASTKSSLGPSVGIAPSRPAYPLPPGNIAPSQQMLPGQSNMMSGSLLGLKAGTQPGLGGPGPATAAKVSMIKSLLIIICSHIINLS